MIEVSDNRSADSDDDGPHARTVLPVAAFAIARLGIDPDSELSIAFVDDDEMARLHVEWMDLPGATDVLSFPMDELRPPDDGQESPVGVLGDLVLAPAFVARQADEHGVSVEAELELLTVHGVLHLVGYDHAEPDEEQAMFALQRDILAEYRAEQGS